MAVVVLALNLRTTVASIVPLLTQVQRDLVIPGAVAGLITALPVLCMAWLAPMAHRVVHRLGAEATVVVAAVLVGAGNGLRLFGAQIAILMLAMVIAGAGIAIAGVALPGLVRELFPRTTGGATGAYTVAMMLGAALAASLAVPAREGLGSWERSLSMWAVPAAAAVLLWWPRARARGHPRRRTHIARASLPWRSRPAWVVATYLSLQAACAYAYLAWLAPAMELNGLSTKAAGLLVGVHNLAQLTTAMALPALADRLHDRRPLILGAVSLTVVGSLWLFLAPGRAPWVAAAVLGLGLGGGFAMGLVTATDYAATPAAATRVTAMAFLLCYTAASIAPIVVGWLHDLTGGFTWPFGLLALLAMAQWSVAARLGPAHRNAVP